MDPSPFFSATADRENSRQRSEYQQKPSHDLRYRIDASTKLSRPKKEQKPAKQLDREEEKPTFSDINIGDFTQFLPTPKDWDDFKKMIEKSSVANANAYHISSKSSKNLSKVDVSDLERVRNLVISITPKMFDDMLNDDQSDIDENKVSSWMDAKNTTMQPVATL